MKRIVWRDLDGTNSREVFYDLAYDYHTGNFSEAELEDFCWTWKAECAADGLNREYWVEEV